MTKLTSAQRTLLEAITGTQDGMLDAMPDTANTASSLIKRGCLISLPQADGPSRLLITEAGRLAIGNPPATSEEEKSPAEPEAAAPAGSTRKAATGKIATLVDILRRPQGATVEAMMEATGWQAHSVRGAISGAIKKGLGLEVISEKIDKERLYRIPAEA